MLTFVLSMQIAILLSFPDEKVEISFYDRHVALKWKRLVMLIDNVSLFVTRLRLKILIYLSLKLKNFLTIERCNWIESDPIKRVERELVGRTRSATLGNLRGIERTTVVVLFAPR